MPCFAPVNVVYPRYTAYAGTMIHNHHALSPKAAAHATHPQVQYSISHRNSVSPFASRSSPAERRSPFSLVEVADGDAVYVGRPIFSSQKWMSSEGADKMMYRINERVVKDRRKSSRRNSK